MLTRYFLAVALCIAATAVGAQSPQKDALRLYGELQWLPPGDSGNLASKATFKASGAYTFLNPADTDKFLKLNDNPPQGSSVTIAPTKGDWFGVLSFASEGYIKDDETIDADALRQDVKEPKLGRQRREKEAGLSNANIRRLGSCTTLRQAESALGMGHTPTCRRSVSCG